MNKVSIEEVFQKACRYCSSSEKSEFEVRRYINKFDIGEQEAKEIIDRLLSDNFINHDRYIKAFVNDKFKFNKWGKIKIVSELRVKGLDSKIIIKHVNNINEDEYISVLTHLLINKLRQLKEKDQYSQKVSLIRFGQSRGFEFEKIEEVLEQIHNKE